MRTGIEGRRWPWLLLRIAGLSTAAAIALAGLALFQGTPSAHADEINITVGDNWFCDSGFITFVIMLTALSKAGTPMSKLIKAVKKYYHSGEINFEVKDAKQNRMRLKHQ